MVSCKPMAPDAGIAPVQTPQLQFPRWGGESPFPPPHRDLGCIQSQMNPDRLAGTGRAQSNPALQWGGG